MRLWLRDELEEQIAVCEGFEEAPQSVRLEETAARILAAVSAQHILLLVATAGTLVIRSNAPVDIPRV